MGGTQHPTPQGPDNHLPHPTVASPTTDIFILTLNTQKAGYNSPSLTDLVVILDLHKPDILLLTETPMHSHHGALAQVLCNRDYKTHYNPLNSPSPPNTLPEARLPTHTTHNGGGFWIAFKKQAPWAATVRRLPLLESRPRATTCAIELTLHSGDKAAIIACYLPQGMDDTP
jgi:hypothetical protein